MSWFTARQREKREATTLLEANSVDETPARAITKLALSRQVSDALNASKRPPSLHPKRERETRGAL